MVDKGSVNGAFKLLTSNISNSVLPLDDKTFNLLNQKHPKSRKLTEEFILRSEKPSVNPVNFEDVDKEKIKIAAVKTKDGEANMG